MRGFICFARRLVPIVMMWSIAIGIGLDTCVARSTKRGDLPALTWVDGSGTGFQRRSRALGKAPTVPFCELVDHPDAYDGKTIITTAVFMPGYLYDADCNSQDLLLWLEADALYNSNRIFRRRLDGLTRESDKDNDSRVRITVLGRFDADGSRYGSLGDFRMQVVVMRLLAVEHAATKFPDASPVPVRLADDILLDLDRTLVLKVAATVNELRDLQWLLADDFTFTGPDRVNRSRAEFFEYVFPPFVIGGKVVEGFEKVHISGDRGIVTSSIIRANPGRIDEHYRFTGTFVLRQNRWQALSLVAERMPSRK